MREADGGWSNHQPAAARRAYGLYTLTRRHFHRTAAGRASGAQRALGFHAEYGKLVAPKPAEAVSARIFGRCAGASRGAPLPYTLCSRRFGPRPLAQARGVRPL